MDQNDVHDVRKLTKVEKAELDQIRVEAGAAFFEQLSKEQSEAYSMLQFLAYISQENNHTLTTPEGREWMKRNIKKLRKWLKKQEEQKEAPGALVDALSGSMVGC